MSPALWEEASQENFPGFKKITAADIISSGNQSGKSTVRGYNAPCFDSMVHYYMGSILMRWDNEDGKDGI